MTNFTASGTLEITEISGNSVTNIEQDLSGIGMSASGGGGDVTGVLSEQLDTLNDIHDTMQKSAVSGGGGGAGGLLSGSGNGLIGGSLTVAASKVLGISGALGLSASSVLAVSGTLGLAAASVLAVNGTIDMSAEDIITTTGVLSVGIASVLAITGALALSAPAVLAVTGAVGIAAASVLAINGTIEARPSDVLSVTGVLTVAAAGALAVTGALSLPAAAAIAVTGVVTIGAAEVIDIVSKDGPPENTVSTGSDFNPYDSVPDFVSPSDVNGDKGPQETQKALESEGMGDFGTTESGEFTSEDRFERSTNRARQRQNRQELDINVNGNLTLDQAQSAGIIPDGEIPPQARRQILDLVEQELLGSRL